MASLHCRTWQTEALSRDATTVEGFGYQWDKFDQSLVDPDELKPIFDLYFTLFPWHAIPADARGIDVGCGSGRWARFAVDRVGTLICIEPSLAALLVARRNAPTCQFVLTSAGELAFPDYSMDFGYCLGVLHYTPEPLTALRDAVRLLRPGAPFLLYVYYALDNRPIWFRTLWQLTDFLRRGVSRLPKPLRYGVSQAIALLVYLPLSRLTAVLEHRGTNVDGWPLSSYRDRSFYTMRTDALDRFGNRIEKRFTKEQVISLMQRAGLERVTVQGPPYWAAIGYKPPST